MPMNRKTQKSGFTLIELVVVMAIIAILTLLAVPRFLSQSERARDTRDAYASRIVENALEAYLMDGSTLHDAFEHVPTEDIQEAAAQGRIFSREGKVTQVDPSDYYRLPLSFIQEELAVNGAFSGQAETAYGTGDGVVLLERSDPSEEPLVPEVQATIATSARVTWGFTSGNNLNRYGYHIDTSGWLRNYLYWNTGEPIGTRYFKLEFTDPALSQLDFYLKYTTQDEVRGQSYYYFPSIRFIWPDGEMTNISAYANLHTRYHAGTKTINLHNGSTLGSTIIYSREIDSFQ